VIGDITVALPLKGVIDMEAEQERLDREISQALDDLKKMDVKLDNPKFIERAKPEAVAETRARKAELEGILKRLNAALKRVKATG